MVLENREGCHYRLEEVQGMALTAVMSEGCSAFLCLVTRGSALVFETKEEGSWLSW